MGDPQPVISWIRGSLHISGSSRYLVEPTGNLVIRNVGKSDEGRYECAARNSIGFVSAAMKLTVQGTYIYTKSALKEFSPFLQPVVVTFEMGLRRSDRPQ